MIAEIKLSVAFIGTVLKSILGIAPKLINLYRRPKAKIEFKQQNIILKNNENIESHIPYPCILISFEKGVKIDVASIKINDESLHGMLSRDPNHLNQGKTHEITNCRVMPFIKNKWQDITSKSCHLELKAHEQEVLPLYVNISMSHSLFTPRKNGCLFFPNKKVTISMNIDGTNCEYGLSLLDISKVIINNLSHR